MKKNKKKTKQSHNRINYDIDPTIGIYHINENRTIELNEGVFNLSKGTTMMCPSNIPIDKTLKKDIHQQFQKLTSTTNLNNKRLLIKRYGGVGDLLCIIPAIYELKKKFPTCIIGIMCSSAYFDILKEYNHIINGICPAIVNYEEIKQFHYFINLENVIESCKDENENIHNLFAKQLFVDIKPSSFSFISKNSNYKRQGIGIQYKTNAIIRDYDLENIIKLINIIHNKYPQESIYLLGKPNDYINTNYIQVKTNGAIIPNGCGERELTYHQSFDLISGLKLVIAPDSSAVHMAGFCNTPLIGLYGPFSSKSRISNYKNAIGIDGISECKPCMRHNPIAWCKWNGCRCLNLDNINLDDIISAVEMQMNLY